MTALRLRNEALSVELHSLGAKLARLQFHGRDLILPCPETIEPSSDWAYFGAIVGPVANRLELRDGLAGWQGANSGVTLHSNPFGLHAVHWDIVEQGEHHAVLSTHMPAGKDGFSANRHITATYRLTAPNRVELSLTATCDAPCLMNLTSHPYWALGPDIGTAGHELEINADTVLPTDANTLPTGAIDPVSGTEFDFRKARTLKAGAPDLDHNFCLAPSRRVTQQLAAKLTGPDGWQMTLETTEPGLQVYDGRGTSGVGLPPRAGLALEPQLWPNAPSHGHFPDIALHPDTPYLAQSTFTLSRP